MTSDNPKPFDKRRFLRLTVALLVGEVSIEESSAAAANVRFATLLLLHWCCVACHSLVCALVEEAARRERLRGRWCLCGLLVDAPVKDRETLN